MANSEHVQVAMHGHDAIEKWREENPNGRLDLSGAFLSSAPLQGANLARADLSGADLNGAHLRMALMGGSNLERAHLHRADMFQADLRGARLIEAYIPGAGLSQARLARADLRGADLSGADLSGADLTRANLTRATLFRASLQGANLGGAILTGVDLGWADMREASLAEAHFFEAKLAHTALAGANFHRAFLLNTIFADCDLGSAANLEEAVHRGPSTIGVDTLFRSAGRIPEEFLRGVGVSEPFIAYLPTPPRSMERRYGCYISYGPSERDFAIKLQADLRASEIDCWRFPAAPTGGGFLEEEIDRGVRFYDKLVVVCSQGAMANDSVRNEINLATQKQRETGRWVLHLLSVDDAIYQRQDRPTRLLRQHRILDFRQLEGAEAYQQALGALSADLRADHDASRGMATASET